MSGGGYPHDHDEVVGVDWNPEAYWTPQRAEDGERFVREAVYGGWSGLAVVRSMAEFCTPSGEQRHGFGLEVIQTTWKRGKNLTTALVELTRTSWGSQIRTKGSGRTRNAARRLRENTGHRSSHRRDA
jgi:hypothetical protein